ncbi:MAG: pilF [Gammaproteobacteria bacterium]|jgi:type IV pilus assembly protein PilF|nr:pilF [Gammaproteobacteria bacterium]
MIHIKRKRVFFLIVCLFLTITGCTSSSSNTEKRGQELSVNSNYDLKRAASINTQLGLAYLKKGDVSRAKGKLLLAIEQNPSDPLAQGAMGYFYEQTGNKTLAKQYYLKSISLAPHRGGPKNNYGTFLCRQGEYKESLPYFTEAVADQDYLQTAEAYENAGLCALMIPDKKTAQRYFEKAVLNDPRRDRALLELADIEFSEGLYNKAKQDLERFHQLDSPTARSLLLGINIADKTGDKTSAANYAAMLKRNFSDSNEYQAYLHAKGG